MRLTGSASDIQLNVFLFFAPALTVGWAFVVRDYPKIVTAGTNLDLARRVRAFALFGGGASLFAALALVVSALYTSTYVAAFVGVGCGLLDLGLFKLFYLRAPADDGDSA